MTPAKPYILEQIEPMIHTQTTPIDDITIFHGKGKECPPVLLVLDDGVTPFEAEIQYLDLDQIRIKMNKAIGFTVYIY